MPDVVTSTNASSILIFLFIFITRTVYSYLGRNLRNSEVSYDNTSDRYDSRTQNRVSRTVYKRYRFENQICILLHITNYYDLLSINFQVLTNNRNSLPMKPWICFYPLYSRLCIDMAILSAI